MAVFELCGFQRGLSYITTFVPLVFKSETHVDYTE